MKLISTSSKSMNKEKHIETTVVADATPKPNGANMKISNVSTITIKWPQIIFANKRTHTTAGYVKMPNNSMSGMIGNGNFNANGTSGQKMSFQ